MKTYKEKFNEKYNQPIDTSNSLKKISELTGLKLSNIKKIFAKAREHIIQILKVFDHKLRAPRIGHFPAFTVLSWEARLQR